MKQVTKEEVKRAKSNHTVKMMLNKRHHKKEMNLTRAKVARDFKRQPRWNALLITVSGDRGKAVIWRLDECEVGGQTICLEDILARMSCDSVVELVGEVMLKEYNNLVDNQRLQRGDRSVHQVGAGCDTEAVIDPAGAKGGEGPNDDDNDEEPAETAVCAFVANNLHKGSNRGTWNPLQQGWKKREKKEPRRIGDPPLSFGQCIRAQPQGCFVCYRRSSTFQQEHRTYPINKADAEAYKKAHRTKKRTSANIWEAKVEFSRDELSKLIMVGSELAKKI